MSTETVASRRMILENPATPGQGIIVAAGDPIPAFAGGYIENTPNKVDAARNHEEADAADQAATRPTERIINRFGNQTAEEAAETASRVGANRAAYDEQLRSDLDPQGWLPLEQAPTVDRVTDDEPADDDEPASSSLEKLTVAQLDDLADQLGDGKPESYSGNKADKVAALSGHVTQADIDRVAGS